VRYNVEMAELAVERRHPPDALMRILNPVTRRLVARGIGGGQVLVLHYRGRRSGRRFDTPAGYHRIDGRVLVFTNSPWRHNVTGGVDIEVTLAGHRLPARATLIPDPHVVTDLYAALFERLGWQAAERRLGVKVLVRRQPTRDELLAAVRDSGLSAVEIEADEPAAPPA
jgi:F420H(2)-dependent quinone reductase